MKQKILFLNTTFGAGGAPQVAKDLWAYANTLPNCEAMYAYGRGPRIVQTNNAQPHTGQPRVVKISLTFETLLQALLVRCFGLEGFGSYFSTRRLIRLIQKEHFDLIHIHNLHGYYLNFGQLFKFLKQENIPVIWTLHDEWAISSLKAHTMGCTHCTTGRGACTSTYSYPKSYVSWFLPWTLRRKQRAFTGMPQLTLAVPAQWLADSIAHSFMRDYPRVLIHNGIDTEVFRPAADASEDNSADAHSKSKEALKIAHGLLPDQLVVFFSAHRLYDFNKGTRYILQAARALAREPYLFVGIGEGGSPSQKNLKLLGRIDDKAALAEWYALADVFCFPSLAETSPLSVLEAMSCGLPVIGFAIPALRGLVEDTITGSLVNVGDGEALTHALQTMMLPANAPLRKQQGRAARERVVQEFSHAEFLQKYGELYQKA